MGMGWLQREHERVMRMYANKGKPIRYEVTVAGYDTLNDRVVEFVGEGQTPATAYSNAVKALEAVITK